MNKLYFLAFLIPIAISLDLGLLVALLNLDKKDYRVHFISNISVLIMKLLGVISFIILIYFKVNLYVSISLIFLLILFNNIYLLLVYNNRIFNIKDLTISLPEDLKDIDILLNFKSSKRKGYEVACNLANNKNGNILYSSLISISNRKDIIKLVLLVINSDYNYKVFVNNIKLSQAEFLIFLKKEFAYK